MDRKQNGEIGAKGMAMVNIPSPHSSPQVGGSLAVLLASLATLSYGSPGQKVAITCHLSPDHHSMQVAIATATALAEGLSKEYDNLFIAAIVILAYRLV